MLNAIKSNSFKKWAAFILLDSFIILAIILFILFGRPFSPPLIKINGVFINEPREVSDFYLQDQNGNAFTKNQLIGHWSLLFFGFTHCPQVCPTTLEALKEMVSILQNKLPAALLPQVVFISIDPEKDSLPRLKKYLASYHPQFIGVKAGLAETEALKKQFSITVTNKKALLEHNTDIIVLNPKAKIQAYFLYPHRPNIMASDYEKLVSMPALTVFHKGKFPA